MRRDAALRMWCADTLYRAGASVGDIAAFTGMAPTTVWRHLRIAGVPLKRNVPHTSPLPRAPYWRLHTRNGSKEVTLGRKYCPGCGRWRHLVDFPPDRRKGHVIGAPVARCASCVNSGRRYYYRHATPEQRDNQREYQRIYHNGKRRERGAPERTDLMRNRVTDRPEYIFLDPAPLLTAIELRCNGSDESLTQLSKVSGVSERAIYRLQHGESAHVRIDNADRLAVGLGLTLELIYHGQGVT